MSYEIKRSGDLGLKTDWNYLFKAFDFSQSSERVLPSDFNGAIIRTLNPQPIQH